METLFYVFLIALLLFIGLIFFFEGISGVTKRRMKLIKRLTPYKEWNSITGEKARLIGIIYILLGTSTFCILGLILFMFVKNWK